MLQFEIWMTIKMCFCYVLGLCPVGLWSFHIVCCCCCVVCLFSAAVAPWLQLLGSSGNWHQLASSSILIKPAPSSQWHLSYDLENMLPLVFFFFFVTYLHSFDKFAMWLPLFHSILFTFGFLMGLRPSSWKNTPSVLSTQKTLYMYIMKYLAVFSKGKKENSEFPFSGSIGNVQNSRQCRRNLMWSTRACSCSNRWWISLRYSRPVLYPDDYIIFFNISSSGS